MKQAVIIIFAALLLQGCMSMGYKDFYAQVAPVIKWLRLLRKNQKLAVFGVKDN